MTRYQDDFYDAINGEWEKTAVIPADNREQVVLSTLTKKLKS